MFEKTYTVMTCKHCGRRVTMCDECGIRFEPGQTIYCGIEKHLCVHCYEFAEHEEKFSPLRFT